VARENRTLNALTDWAFLTNLIGNGDDVRKAIVTSDPLSVLKNKTIIKKDVGGAEFSWTLEEREITEVVRIADSEQYNIWKAVDPFRCTVNKKGNSYSFGNQTVSVSQEDVYTYTWAKTYVNRFVGNYANQLNYTVGDNTKKSYAFGTYYFSGDPTYFPEAWGSVVGVYQSKASNERGNSYVYIWSIHFSNGYVLPVVVRIDAAQPEWNFAYVEYLGDMASVYNSAKYNEKLDRWINTSVPSDNMVSRFRLDYANGVLEIEDLKMNHIMGRWTYYDDVFRITGPFEVNIHSSSKYLNGKVFYNDEEVYGKFSVDFTEPIPMSFKFVPNPGSYLKMVTRNKVNASGYLNDDILCFNNVCSGMDLEFVFEEIPKISAKNQSREYGDANPSFEFGVTGGTIASGNPIYTCEATPKSPIGTYPIVISKGSIANKEVELENGTLTITKAPLTIIVEDCSKTEGTNNPEFILTYSGFKNGETKSVLTKLPSVTCNATKNSTVGSYPIIISGAEAENYYFIYVNGTLAVQEKGGMDLNDGDCFIAKSIEGIEITFQVISAKNKTCRVLGDENSHAAVAVSSWVEGELTIPAAANGYTVTEIGDKAFFGCNKLTKVNIPNGVKSIGSDAFWGCKGLTTLDIPSSMTTIGGGAFEDCAGLTSILFPKSITSVGNVIFRGCTELKYVVIEKGVKSIGIGTFYGCNKLSDVYCQSNNVVGGGDSFDNPEKKTLHVPSVSINSYKKAYGWKDFGNIVALKNGDPGYIEGAESDNDEDDESDIIKFADSKTKEICLKYWDTDEDGKLSKTEAAAVLWIGNAFVESDITSFNEFSYFTAVTDIDDAAFRKCKNLQEITLPNSATSIGKQTFAYCQNLTKVVMSNSMSSIGDYAFIGCSSLASIELTDNLTKIGVGAFENCSALSTINIPASVFYIGGSPFDSCSGLMSINVNSGNMRYCSVDGVLFDKACTKLVQYPIGKIGSEYVIPSTVVTIGEGAFISSTNLHTITIPESVTTIELGAFMDCTSLEMITIPLSVTSLAKYSFYGCTGLKSVTSITANPFEIESNVFETSNNTFTTATLYVPTGSASKYQALGGWKNFKKFMPIGDVNGDNSINDADTKEEADYIMGNPSKTYVKAAGDMNGDGVINVVDIVLMRDMINSNK
jgi:hypothetical protein